MTINPDYITTVDLSPYLVDKDTGVPLSGGFVYFYKDEDRTSPKLVYQLSGAPPNYTYTALPNPLVVSSVGTLQDNSGNNVAVYYYPFNEDEELELYYIRVTNSLGVEQFTREAWPNVTAESIGQTAAGAIVNQISNPQFAFVNFDPSSSLVISFNTGSNTVVPIAPDWNLVISPGASSGTVTVARTSVIGSAGLPTNPPYTLTVTPGLNVAGLFLEQTLPHNTDIWSPAPGATNGYVSTNVTLGDNSSLTINYVPSSGASTQIFSENNTTGFYEQYNQVVQLTPVDNSDDSDDGDIIIRLVLPISKPTTLTSIQVVGVESNLSNVVYVQDTVNRQQDYLFNYYNSLLQQKPIPSYLIGWDFPLNPAQFLGSSVSEFATGANTSNYIWDQTICFQSTTSGVSFSRASSGALTITGQASGKFALIQYLEQADAREILRNNLSVNVLGCTNRVGGLTGTVSLWYTSAGSLPAMGSNASIVAMLDDNGHPSAVNGSFLEVPTQKLGNAQFDLAYSTTTYSDYGFGNWFLNDTTAADAATYFAIVVGFGVIDASDTVTIQSISLVPGKIPTRPAPESSQDVLRDCQYFYEKSFPISTAPAQNVGNTNGCYQFYQTVSATATQKTVTIPYKVQKRITTPSVVTYNPTAANPYVYNSSVGGHLGDFSSTAVNFLGQWGFTILGATGGASASGNDLFIHWTSDARLGY